MAESRTRVVLRAPAIDDLLAYPEFRERVIDAILYLLEVGNEDKTSRNKIEGDTEVRNDKKEFGEKTPEAQGAIGKTRTASRRIEG